MNFVASLGRLKWIATQDINLVIDMDKIPPSDWRKRTPYNKRQRMVWFAPQMKT